MVADAGLRRPLNPHFICGEEEGHTISRPSDWFGEAKGRYMTAGEFSEDRWIKIDIRLENRPDDAREVLSAETAHAVDYGLPLSEAQKTAIMRLFHGGGTDVHTWWESIDYSSEYYTLGGVSRRWRSSRTPTPTWSPGRTRSCTKACAQWRPMCTESSASRRSVLGHWCSSFTDAPGGRAMATPMPS